MRRREFISLLGGAAIGLPLATHGQAAATRRIGALIAPIRMTCFGWLPLMSTASCVVTNRPIYQFKLRHGSRRL
jgi:hypothetical protein